MGVSGLRIGLMEYVFSYPKGIVIPSSCIYKLSQSSNYEIGDCFYNEGIAQKHGFKL
jgi:hypothetical protein